MSRSWLLVAVLLALLALHGCESPAVCEGEDASEACGDDGGRLDGSGGPGAEGGRPDAGPSEDAGNADGAAGDLDGGDAMVEDGGSFPDADAGWDAGDAGTDADATQPEGAMAIGDAGDGDAGDGDAGPADGVIGASCSSGAECASGHCPSPDGVCCDLPCDETCLSCLQADTGFADGICAPVIEGMDPAMECTDHGASSCGSNGDGCNGSFDSPACILYESGTQCAPALCESGTGLPPRQCDGDGVCEPAPEPTPCGAYACDGAGTTCLDTCAGDGDCAAPYTCQGDGECQLTSSGAEVVWILTREAELPLDGLNDALYGITATPDGGAVAHLRCAAATIPDLRCAALTGDSFSRIDAAGTTVESVELQYRSLGSTVLVGPTGAVTAGATFYQSGGSGAVVQSYRADDTILWSKTHDPGFGFGTITQSWTALDGVGSVVVRFRHTDSEGFGYDFGSGPSDGPRLVKYNAAGLVLWDQAWESAARLVGTPDAGLVGLAEEREAATLGCAAEADTAGVYVAKFDSTADCVWGNAAGGELSDGELVVDDAGDIVVAALVAGSIDFGAGPVAAVGEQDLLLARLDPDGYPRWVRRFSGDGFSGTELHVSVNASGDTLLAGGFEGSIDVGAGPILASAGASYVAQFDSDGILRGQHQFTGEIQASITPTGDFFVASIDNSFEIGEGALFTTGGFAVVKMRF